MTAERPIIQIDPPTIFKLIFYNFAYYFFNYLHLCFSTPRDRHKSRYQARQKAAFSLLLRSSLSMKIGAIHPQIAKCLFADGFFERKRHPQICKYHSGDVFLS